MAATAVPRPHIVGMRLARLPFMATEARFKDAEEREISRGGKATAFWTIGLAVALVAGGIALAFGLRQHVSPPSRPGTTSATSSAGEAQPPSP